MALLYSNQSIECVLEHCWLEIKDKITEDELYYFDICFCISTSVLLTVGVPLNLAIIHHEWYGGDGQKRSLPNRFMSNSVLCDMLASISIQTFTALLRSESVYLLQMPISQNNTI